MEPKICKFCNKEFIPRAHHQKICNDEHFLPCPVCGKPVKWIGFYRCCSKECTREKRKQTCLERFGSVAPAGNKEIQSKIKQTCLDKYGVEYVGQSREIKKKQVATYYARYGKEQNPEGYADLLERTKQTCLERYGEEKNFRSESHKQKLREANMRKYGVENACFNIDVISKMQASRTSSVIHRLFGSDELKAKVAILNNGLDLKSDQTDKLCDIWIEILETAGLHSIKNYNIGDYTYSLCIEDQKILICLDPSTTHNCYMNVYDVEQPGPVSTHHLAITRNAEKYGYRCIHVFDWDDMFQIIPLILPKENISAHKCEILELTPFEANLFLDVFCLTGRHIYSKQNIVYLGLFYKGSLVQVGAFRKTPRNKTYDAEFVKLCSDSEYHVLGGASKIFQYYISHYHPKSVFAYCDRSKFTGDVYEKIGMKFIRSHAPDLIWNKGSYRVKDVNLKMSKYYDKVLGRDYDRSKPEHQGLLEAGYLPVYDCGKDFYEWRTQD